MALHVVHLAVEPGIQPAQQVLLVLRDRDARRPPGRQTPGHGARSRSWSLAAARSMGAEEVMAVLPGQYNEPMPLPTALYSTAQVRALDAHAIESLGIPGYTLMKRAGEAALRYLRTRWPMSPPHRHRLRAAATTAATATCWRASPRPRDLTVTVLARSPCREAAAGMRGHALADFKASGGIVQPFAAEHLAAGRGHRRCAAGHGAERPGARQASCR